MNEFVVRAYAKSELAMVYFPSAITPHAAVNMLMTWIKRDDDGETEEPVIREKLEMVQTTGGEGNRRASRRAIVDNKGWWAGMMGRGGGQELL